MRLLWMVASFATIYLADAQLSNDVRRYKPDWDDLDKRPLPEWYDRAKVGIFLHWGVFSVPSFGSEWFWSHWNSGSIQYLEFMKKNYPPNFSYQDFGPMFTAEFFDANEWADLFKKSGAKFIVLTTKHHEGYTLFPSKRSFSWNSVDVGPHRDLAKELSEAVRAKGLKFGAYHSLFEWFNPIYQVDRANLYKTRDYVINKLYPDLEQLIEDYKPSVLWSDGDWECTSDYWNSTGFLSWLYNDSPVKDEIVTNDRWGIGTGGKHGDFYNYADKFNPGELLPHKWENAFTIDHNSWGYRRNIRLSDVHTLYGLINQTVTTVSCGGNVLINVGPTKEGTISAIFQERLIGLGTWLGINGEAIYSSSPWRYQKDELDNNVWYTCTKTTWDAHHPIAPPANDAEVTAVYAMVMVWPPGNVLKLKDITSYITKGTTAVLLGNEEALKVKVNNGVTEIHFPDKATVKNENAWTIKFTQQKFVTAI